MFYNGSSRSLHDAHKTDQNKCDPRCVKRTLFTFCRTMGISAFRFHCSESKFCLYASNSCLDVDHSHFYSCNRMVMCCSCATWLKNIQHNDSRCLKFFLTENLNMNNIVAFGKWNFAMLLRYGISIWIIHFQGVYMFF